MRFPFLIALMLPLAALAQANTAAPLMVVGSGEAPLAPEAPAAAAPANPASPTPPAGPVSKLWPRDSIAIFLPPCTGLRPQYFAPCTCIITKLMVAMGHDEFLQKSEDGTLEQDPRLQQIRLDCVTAPAKKE